MMENQYYPYPDSVSSSTISLLAKLDFCYTCLATHSWMIVELNSDQPRLVACNFSSQIIHILVWQYELLVQFPCNLGTMSQVCAFFLKPSLTWMFLESWCLTTISVTKLHMKQMITSFTWWRIGDFLWKLSISLKIIFAVLELGIMSKKNKRNIQFNFLNLDFLLLQTFRDIFIQSSVSLSQLMSANLFWSLGNF